MANGRARRSARVPIERERTERSPYPPAPVIGHVIGQRSTRSRLGAEYEPRASADGQREPQDSSASPGRRMWPASRRRNAVDRSWFDASEARTCLDEVLAELSHAVVDLAPGQRTDELALFG